MLDIKFNKFDKNGNDTFIYSSFKQYAREECSKNVLIGSLIGLSSGFIIAYLIK